MRNLVFANTRVERGRTAVRLSRKYTIYAGWSSPRIAFVGANAEDSNSIAIYEFTNSVDGGVVYAPYSKCWEGWEQGPIAFYAFRQSTEGRIEMTPAALSATGESIYMTVPSDILLQLEGAQALGKETFYVQTLDRSRWMEQTPAIHNKKLRHICLPATHDAATSVLQDIKTDDNGEDIAGFLNTLKEIGDAIAATGIGIIIDIPLWLSDNLFGVVKGLGRAQGQSIRSQLEGGIRGLDLRVYYYAQDDTFYTYHGALGEKLETVLDDIQGFVASRPGEIVYTTITHLRHVDTPALKSRLTSMIQSKIGGFAYVRTGTNDDTLFEQTYDAIVSQNQSGSKVVIVYSESAAEFWPPSAYSGGGSSRIEGSYSNSSDIDTMLQKQIDNYDNAVDRDKPFSLFMTLTPQESDVYVRVAASIAGPLAVAALPVLLIPFGFIIFALVEALAASLAILGEALGWRTLEQLSARLSPTLAQKVSESFVPAEGPNLISLVWVDFYENTGIVDLAISLSQKS